MTMMIISASAPPPMAMMKYLRLFSSSYIGRETTIFTSEFRINGIPTSSARPLGGLAGSQMPLNSPRQCPLLLAAN